MSEENLNRESPGPPAPRSSSPEHSIPPPRKPRRWFAWILVLLLFGVAFYLVLHHKEQGAPGAGARRGGFGTVTITEATTTKGSIGIYLDAIGTVTPVYTSSITAQAAGVVTAVHYREGQIVREGDALIDIDPRIYQAQVLEAEGALERDTNVLAQAKMDLERYRAAWARNAIPKQQLDDQEKLVLQDQGTVKNDQGTLQFDQTQLAYTHIASPINGRVGLRLVDPGNLAVASAATALAVVTQLQPITVVFTIPEDNVSQLEQQMKHGKPLPVDALDRTNQSNLASGKLEATDNQIDTTTGTLKLRAIFPNKDNALFPNQFVNARLLLQTLENVVLIPSSAIQHNGDASYVFLIQNNVAHIHNIKPGVSEASVTEVQGLNAGDVIADSSFEKLQDGAAVHITKQVLLPSNNESDAP